MIWTAVLSGALAFVGAMVGHVLTRRSSKELDVWRRREETMRMLRWAADRAVAGGRLSEIGVAALDALGKSELLQSEDQGLVDDVMSAVVARAD